MITIKFNYITPFIIVFYTFFFAGNTYKIQLIQCFIHLIIIFTCIVVIFIVVILVTSFLQQFLDQQLLSHW
uniref:Uncharacterized protein n=1 Tax=Panstrongylus lignarius TaxID=156445 RepID=A0A224Y4T1_9HEMI